MHRGSTAHATGVIEARRSPGSVSSHTTMRKGGDGSMDVSIWVSLSSFRCLSSYSGCKRASSVKWSIG